MQTLLITFFQRHYHITITLFKLPISFSYCLCHPHLYIVIIVLVFAPFLPWNNYDHVFNSNILSDTAHEKFIFCPPPPPPPPPSLTWMSATPTVGARLPPPSQNKRLYFLVTWPVRSLKKKTQRALFFIVPFNKWMSLGNIDVQLKLRIFTVLLSFFWGGISN